MLARDSHQEDPHVGVEFRHHLATAAARGRPLRGLRAGHHRDRLEPTLALTHGVAQSDDLSAVAQRKDATLDVAAAHDLPGLGEHSGADVVVAVGRVGAIVVLLGDLLHACELLRSHGHGVKKLECRRRAVI